MNRPIVFMFSGQGSQYYHMGKELFNNHPTFRNCMMRMDTLLLQHIGQSVVNEIYNSQRGIADRFDYIVYTHPAIFMIEYSLCQILLEKGIMPDYLIGASLGEFTSAAVSGILSIEDSIECIVRQALLFKNYCRNGGMIAIINDFRLYYETPQLYENSELASINYNSHFVISGDTEKLNVIVNFLKKKNIIYQLLPVSYGFHSSLMDPAEKAFTEFLQRKSYQAPSLPFISCSLGDRLTEVYSDFFWDVVRKPIQFQEAIQYLENQQECIYLDLGPAGTLVNFLKHSHSGNFMDRCYSIITPFNQELKYLKKVESLFQ